MSASTETTDIVENDVRGVPMRLVAYTRALRLCARMNYETEVLDFIDGMSPGDVLYDLGACEGRFALYAALRGVSVWAFEPEAMNFQAMLRNLELNPAARKRLAPKQLAVGEKNGSATLKIAQPWAGGHQKVVSTAPSRVDLDFNFVSEQRIEVVSLDDFARAMSLPAPNYLKVDVDGSELSFLLGARETLRSPSLRSVMFELHKDDMSFQTAVSELGEAGFEKTAEHLVEPGLFNVLFLRSPEN